MPVELNASLNMVLLGCFLGLTLSEKMCQQLKAHALHWIKIREITEALRRGREGGEGEGEREKNQRERERERERERVCVCVV